MVPTTTRSSWSLVKNLAQQYPQNIFYALGLHPYFLSDEVPTLDLQTLSEQLSKKTRQVVAVGECGLDAMISVSQEVQERVFVAQIGLALEHRLPIVLHSRKTHHRILQLLKQHHFDLGGVLHGFTGSEQQARQFIDMGFKIGVGGSITYPRANKTRTAIAALPIDALVLETDAPDMPLNGFQGQPNTPARLPIVLTTLADLRGDDPSMLEQQLWQNSLSLFHLRR